MGQEMQQCIRDCEDCHHTCVETAAYCLRQGGRHAQHTHTALLHNCAELCETTAHFMIAGSELHGRVCAVCAEVSDRCAQSCDQFADDPQMQACAEACRRCAESCRGLTTAA